MNLPGTESFQLSQEQLCASARNSLARFGRWLCRIFQIGQQRNFVVEASNPETHELAGVESTKWSEDEINTK
jgi:hypothetical protein